MKTIRQQILEAIKNHDTIIIHRHVNPDPDALGSQGGLQHILMETFPMKSIFVVGEEVEGLTFLNRMDEISDKTYHDALVIVCDTANEARVSDERFKTGKMVIKIDHHPDNEPFGDLSWVDMSYSSASEMIVDFVREFDELQINAEAARLLYAGLIGDTGRFLYDNTTSRTFDAASELLKYPFDPQEIYNTLYKTSQNTARLHGHALLNYQVTDNGVAYLQLSEELLNEFGVSTTDAANLVNVLNNIEGNKVWVFFVQYPDEIRVRIRSKNININPIAREFDGGGHPLASGAKVQSWDEAEVLIARLKQYVSEQTTVSN